MKARDCCPQHTLHFPDLDGVAAKIMDYLKSVALIVHASVSAGESQPEEPRKFAHYLLFIGHAGMSIRSSIQDNRRTSRHCPGVGPMKGGLNVFAGARNDAIQIASRLSTVPCYICSSRFGFDASRKG